MEYIRLVNKCIVPLQTSFQTKLNNSLGYTFTYSFFNFSSMNSYKTIILILADYFPDFIFFLQFFTCMNRSFLMVRNILM